MRDTTLDLHEMYTVTTARSLIIQSVINPCSMTKGR